MPWQTLQASGPLFKRYVEFPASVLETWPTPNYINPTTRGPTLYIINSIVFFCMLICVALRLYIRLAIRHWFGPDDVFIVLAVVGAIGVTTVVLLGYRDYNWDRHTWDLHINLIEPAGKTLYASKIIWSFTSNCVRASIICLYYRLLDHIGMNQWRWVLHINALFNLGVFLEQQCTFIFTCIPIHALWTFPQDPTAKCINSTVVQIAAAMLNTFSELVLAALPIPLIFTLNMSQRQRNEVLFLLGGGFLVVVCGCVRTYFVWMSCVTYDPGWWASPHWIASEVEMDVAIVCSCIPVLRPVVGRVLSRGFTAAKLSNTTDPASSKAGSRGRRYKDLFRKRSSQASSLGYSSNATRSVSTGQGVFRHVDLEGIGNDGYGYNVTIRTEHGTRVRKRWDIRNKLWHYYPEEPEILNEEDSSTVLKSQSRSAFSTIHRESTSRPIENPKQVHAEVISVPEKAGLEMQQTSRNRAGTRDSVPQSMITAQRQSKTEEDIEIAMRVPEAPISDWSLINGETNERPVTNNGRDILRSHALRVSQPPELPRIFQHNRPETAHMPPRQPTIQTRSSAEYVRPRTSVEQRAITHRIIRSQDNIRTGILPSPSTLPRLPSSRSPSPATRSQRSMPIPPALPLSGRFPRTVKPVLSPLNSSQPWATSPLTFLQQSQSQSQQGSSALRAQKPEEHHQASAGPRFHHDPSVVGSFLDQQTPPSLTTSGEQDGESGTGLNRLSSPSVDEGESSEEDLDLPLQRPSPRNSLAYSRRQQSSQPPVQNMRVRGYL